MTNIITAIILRVMVLNILLKNFSSLLQGGVISHASSIRRILFLDSAETANRLSPNHMPINLRCKHDKESVVLADIGEEPEEPVDT